MEHEEHIDDEEGKLDLTTNIRLFLYVVLYRPTNESLYTRVYNPVVVYHDLYRGCLSQGDGLDWVVKQGDLLGAFIPENCTTPEDLISRNDVDTFDEMKLMDFEFCPAQLNLVNGPGQCFHALYLNTSEGIPLNEIEYINYEKITNVSTRLNIGVMIKEQGKGL